MATNRLRVLVVEDNPADARLMTHELQKSGLAFEAIRVETESVFVGELDRSPDVILCDYALPQFDGLGALKIVQDRGLDIPFILVSGSIGEELAVQAMRQGASDYLLKDRLGRLGEAVKQALDQRKTREAERQAVRALRENEERTRKILDTANDPFVAIDANGLVIDWNLQAEATFGWSRGEVMGRKLSAILISPSQREACDRGRERWLSQGASLSMRTRHEVVALHRNGHEIPAELTVWPVQVGGQVTFTAFLRDISQRKRAEKALGESQARLHAALESGGIGTWVWDVNEDRVWWDDSLAKLFGRSPEEVAESRVRTFLEFVHPEDRARAASVLQEAIQGHPLRSFECRILLPNGSMRWITSSGKADRSEGEVPLRLTGASVNITERKQAELRLATQGAVSRALAQANSINEAAPLVLQALAQAEGWDFGSLWLEDKQARVMKCVDTWHARNSPAEELANRSRRETFSRGVGLVGRVWDFAVPFTSETLQEKKDCPLASIADQVGLDAALGFPVVLREEVIGVVVFFGPSGIAIEAKMLEMFAAIGHQLGHFIERKKEQEELRHFVSFSPSVLYALEIRDGQLEFLWCSNNIVHLTGFRHDEVTGREWWFNQVHPDDRGRVLAAHPVPFDLDHLILEYRLRRKDGSDIWLRDEKRLVRHPSGLRSEVIGSWSDVTERVQLEQQLRQAQKLEAIGQLAGGIAHDFNNLLTVITGYSELMMAPLPAHDPQKPLLGEIRHAGERAASLTRQLLAFSRKSVVDPKILDLDEVVRSLEKLLRRLIGEDIALDTDLAPGTSRVRIDPAQIEQVVINLAVNARDAMPQGGRLHLKVHDVELDEEACRSRPESRPGRYVMLAMTDTGCGMPSDVLAHIFEPFFTTKEPGKGTGLGLATVFGIVKQNQGFIEVQTEVEKGSTFRVYLPDVQSRASSSRGGSGPGLVARGTETVLIVEDEEGVRSIASLALTSQGYRVIEAPNGRKALVTAQDHPGPIHLLITDVVMPEMSGRQLADLLMERFPALKVLFISGYIDDAMIRHGLSATKVPFLQKPFSPSILARKVRDVLEGVE